MTATTEPDNPFANEILAFEAADRAHPPPANAVLFVGSSTIRLWPDVQRDFPGVPTINRGFGGASTPDLLLFMDRIVIPCRPRAVVFYCGDNDLGNGRAPRQVLKDIREFVTRIHATLPTTTVLLLSVKPSPHRWSLVDKMKAVNAGLREMAEQEPSARYVDVFTPMLGNDGLPRPDLYADDGLHMSPAGYALWKTVLRPHIR